MDTKWVRVGRVVVVNDDNDVECVLNKRDTCMLEKSEYAKMLM